MSIIFPMFLKNFFQHLEQKSIEHFMKIMELTHNLNQHNLLLLKVHLLHHSSSFIRNSINNTKRKTLKQNHLPLLLQYKKKKFKKIILMGNG